MDGLSRVGAVLAAVMIAVCPGRAADGVRFHLSFDDESYLAEDYSHRIGLRSGLDPDLRGLELVDGVFGSGLHSGRKFVPDDWVQTHLSVRDLDTLLTVIAHHRFRYFDKGLEIGWMQPYFWGTGRLSTDGGTIAFWAKGERTEPGHLFFQGSSSFGRFEKNLLGIDLLEDGSLEAWIVDARYERHAIRTAAVWESTEFNHVALTWDRGMGLTLFLNGEEVATNWGEVAWWGTQIPGLFHMPMAEFTFDELWVLDGAIGREQVVTLMRENRPPEVEAIQEYDEDSIERLSESFVGPGRSALPVLGPLPEGMAHRFREIPPVWAGDGAVRAPYVMDGMRSLAWPQEYTSFTNILGDSDFHPEQVDIHLAEGAAPNHLTISGNLSGVRVVEGATDVPRSSFVERATVPAGVQFFHAQDIRAARGELFSIPFVRGYGSPDGYAPGLHLPLTGDMRVHEITFHHREEALLDEWEAEKAVTWFLSRGIEPELTGRYDYAWRTLSDRRGSALIGLAQNGAGTGEWMLVEPMTRVTIVSPPVQDDKALLSLLLDLRLKGFRDGGFAVFTLRDPGVPSRVWYEVVARLEGFEGDGERFRLHLDPEDIRMPAGDRMYLEILFEHGAAVAIGGEDGSTIVAELEEMSAASEGYVLKAIQPALSDFAKIYYWYYPWIWAGDEANPEAPVTFGGWYNIMNHTLSVHRSAPDHPLVSALYKLSLFDREIDPGFNPPAWENSPEYWPEVELVGDGRAPEWALYMRHYLAGLEDVVEWWATRQMADGQVGGGWNDDVMFASRLPGPFLYLEDNPSRRMFERIFEGIDHTRMFEGGYCNIVPMDDIHATDLVRHRYEGILFQPGDALMTTRSLQTAWRLGKPDETPENYHDGLSFKYDNDVIRWYWGERSEYPEHMVTEEHVTETVRKFARAINDVLYFRYTDSGMFTDGFTFPGSHEVKSLVTGGQAGPFLEALSLAARWEDGPGTAMPRWVEHASDTRFEARMYSFLPEASRVAVRMLRLRPGEYRITLREHADGAPGRVLHTSTRQLPRFAVIDFSIYPSLETQLSVELVDGPYDPGPLPDLAVGHLWRSGSWIMAEILNLGNAPASEVLVTLQDSAGRIIATRRIEHLDSAEDFVPGSELLKISVLGIESPHFDVQIDPDNTQREILKNNNQGRVEW